MLSSLGDDQYVIPDDLFDLHIRPHTHHGQDGSGHFGDARLSAVDFLPVRFRLPSQRYDKPLFQIGVRTCPANMHHLSNYVCKGAPNRVHQQSKLQVSSV